jgi:hypothetical protein
VNFAAITVCIASELVFIFVVHFVVTQYGNLWIHSPNTNLSYSVHQVAVLPVLSHSTVC